MKPHIRMLAYIALPLIGFWLGHSVGVNAAWRSGTAFTANQLLQAHKMTSTMTSDEAADKILRIAKKWQKIPDSPDALMSVYNPAYIYDSFTLAAEKDLRRSNESYLAAITTTSNEPK
jgi:uncharacterized protein YyaL (SSP411 family)